MAASITHARYKMSTKISRWFRHFSSNKGPKSKSYRMSKANKSDGSRLNSSSPMSFQQMCELRRQQAHRSVLVQVPSKKHIATVYNQIKHCGNVKHIFHFSHIRDYALIELENRSVVDRLLRTASHFSNDEKIPVESRVFLFTGSDGMAKHWQAPVVIHSESKERFQLSDCYNAEDISGQIKILYEKNRLTDLGCRLRFFVCSKLEDLLSGLFPHCVIQPFGSTVNGFGKHDCDLDMTLKLLLPEHQFGRISSLKFMTKKRTDNERGFTQRSLQTVADIIEQFVPLCLGVQRILNARVPIIKFRNDACNVECDLSFNHISGQSMAEVLWMFSEIDPRVAPLVFCIRHWARVNEVSRKHPGPWASNFMLTALVIFYLQTCSQPVLPKLSSLKTQHDPGDGVVSPFLSDYSLIPKTSNEDNLGDLLMGFFAFYSTFDFQSQAMSVIEGAMFHKPDYSPVYIENPLDVNLNICKNINIPELEKLKKGLETALWNLETSSNRQQQAWGLMNILVPNGAVNNSKLHVTVGELFNEGSEVKGQQNSQNTDGSVRTTVESSP